jgi:Kef-type K+ transport system membrane component KefB
LTVAFFALGLTIVPRAVKRINEARWNIFAQQSPIGYSIGLMLAYCVIAGTLEVNLVFAAFLAGFAVAQEKQDIFADAMESIGKVSLASLIPVYFAIVGLKLDLIHGISLWLIVIFLAGSSAIKMLSVSVAGRFAGFRGLDLINLGMTTNARGGPGIVLASIAFDAGIISATFYTTLVIVAVLTSQFAGAWLDYIRRKGWPLLKGDAAAEEAVDVSSEGRADGVMPPNNPDAGQTAGVDPGTQAQ